MSLLVSLVKNECSLDPALKIHISKCGETYNPSRFEFREPKGQELLQKKLPREGKVASHCFSRPLLMPLPGWTHTMAPPFTHLPCSISKRGVEGRDGVHLLRLIGVLDEDDIKTAAIWQNFR